jgi:hypothetical protein
MHPRQLLEEFVRQIERLDENLKSDDESVRREALERLRNGERAAPDWHGMARLYAEAKEMLELDRRLHYDSENPFRIRRWISTGELAGEPKDVSELLERAARNLDRSCAYDILGDALFEGEDGKLYTCFVEAVIDEAAPEFAREIIEREHDND